MANFYPPTHNEMSMTKSIILAAACFASMAGAIIYDNNTKTVVSTGVEYVYSYSRCAQFVPGAKGISHCSKYVPASEKRVPVVYSHFGGLFETTGYLVK
jgi:hypothetical protein